MKPELTSNDKENKMLDTEEPNHDAWVLGWFIGLAALIGITSYDLQQSISVNDPKWDDSLQENVKINHIDQSRLDSLNEAAWEFINSRDGYGIMIKSGRLKAEINGSSKDFMIKISEPQTFSSNFINGVWYSEWSELSSNDLLLMTNVLKIANDKKSKH